MRQAPLLLAAQLALLLVGCAPAQKAEEPVQPFVFRSLELRQKDNGGRPSWEISSPEARYDQSRKLAQARDLRGTIYEHGRPLYRIRARRGVVLNDGEVVLLEGPTEVRRLGQDSIVIQAQRVRWYPFRGEMAVDRQAVARQKNLEVTAKRAHFDFNRNRLVLSGAPLLRERGPAPLRLALVRLTWWAASGEIQAEGPIRGERRGLTGERQLLTSPSLRGNTLQQELVLAAPVRLQDPGRQAELGASDTHLELRSQRISSALPFDGRYGALRVRGEGFSMLPDSGDLEIPRGCVLGQPGERLSADRCEWNWRTRRVRASGGVRLERQAQQLTTQAGELEGRIGGDEGLVVLSQPGGTVQTQLRLEARR